MLHNVFWMNGCKVWRNCSPSQLVQCLLCKYEDISLNNQHPWKTTRKEPEVGSVCLESQIYGGCDRKKPSVFRHASFAGCGSGMSLATQHKDHQGRMLVCFQLSWQITGYTSLPLEEQPDRLTFQIPKCLSMRTWTSIHFIVTGMLSGELRLCYTFFPMCES